MVPVVGVDHVPTTAFAMEAYVPTTGPTTSVPLSGLIPVHKEPGSAASQGLETLPTVSECAMLAIVIAHYWSLAHIFGSIIAHDTNARSHNASIQGIRTKSLCESLSLFALGFC